MESRIKVLVVSGIRFGKTSAADALMKIPEIRDGMVFIDPSHVKRCKNIVVTGPVSFDPGAMDKALRMLSADVEQVGRDSKQHQLDNFQRDRAQWKHNKKRHNQR